MFLDNQKKIPLIYILSNGRSGTTILDMLLGTHPNVWTTGEAQILPWEIKKNISPCGCGKELTECDFWKGLIPTIKKYNEIFPIHFFREKPGGGQVIRYRLLLDFYLNKIGGEHLENIIKYAEANFKIFKSIGERATSFQEEEISYLVDASKDLYRLLWLQESGLFNIRVIHLIKDPRAFVHSMTKNDKYKFNKTVRMALRWKIENYLMDKLCKKYFQKQNFRRLKYETMAGAHQKVMGEIFHWLGLGDNQEQVDEFRDKQQHAISGNKARWENKKIYLDESWKEDMPLICKKITNLIA